MYATVGFLYNGVTVETAHTIEQSIGTSSGGTKRGNHMLSQIFWSADSVVIDRTLDGLKGRGFQVEQMGTQELRRHGDVNIRCASISYRISL